MVKVFQPTRTTKEKTPITPKQREIKKKAYIDLNKVQRFAKKSQEVLKLSQLVDKKFQALNLLPYSYNDDNIGSYTVDELKLLDTFEDTTEWYLLKKRLEPLSYNLSLIILNKDKIFDMLVDEYKEREINRIPVLKLLFNMIRDLKGDIYQLMLENGFEIILHSIESVDLKLMEYGVLVLAGFIKFSNQSIKADYLEFLKKLTAPLFTVKTEKKTLKLIADSLVYTYKKEQKKSIKRDILNTFADNMIQLCNDHSGDETIQRRIIYFSSCYFFNMLRNFKNTVEFNFGFTLENIVRISVDNEVFLNLMIQTLRLVFYKFYKLEFRYRSEEKMGNEFYLSHMLIELIELITKENDTTHALLLDTFCDMCVYQDGRLIDRDLLSKMIAFLNENSKQNFSEKYIPLASLLILQKSILPIDFGCDTDKEEGRVSFFSTLVNEVFFQERIKNIKLNNLAGKRKLASGTLDIARVDFGIVQSLFEFIFKCIERNGGVSDIAFKSSLSIVAELFRIKKPFSSMKVGNTDIKHSLIRLLDFSNTTINQADCIELFLKLNFLDVIDLYDVSESLTERLDMLLNRLLQLKANKQGDKQASSLSNFLSFNFTEYGHRLEILGFQAKPTPQLLSSALIAKLTYLLVNHNSNDTKRLNSLHKTLLSIVEEHHNKEIILDIFNRFYNTVKKMPDQFPQIISDKLYSSLIQNLSNRNIRVVQTSLTLLCDFEDINKPLPNSNFLKDNLFVCYLDEVN